MVEYIVITFYFRLPVLWKVYCITIPLCLFVSLLLNQSSDFLYNIRFEVFTAWLWRMPSSGMLHHVDVIITDVLEELITCIVRVTRICKLGTTLAVTSNGSTLQRNTMLFLACWFSSPLWWRRYVPPKRWFLQEPHYITSKKMEFFRFSLFCQIVSHRCSY
jgi:hypothetical protein